MEERNNSFSTNYLFNAKELDNETGLYYYGARYLDPTGAMWLSVDPLFEKYAGMTPYNYCAGNPVKLVDPDGRDIINDDAIDYHVAVQGHSKRTNEFYKKYGDNADNLKRSDFKDSEKYTYRDYRKDKRDLKRSSKDVEVKESYYTNTQNEIIDFMLTCPDLYSLMDNLTYDDENLETHKLDIHISSNPAKSSKNVYSMGGAYSAFGERSMSARIYLGMNLKRGGHLAHEMGHVMSYSILPEIYIQGAAKEGDTHNCQNEYNKPPLQRHFISILAIEFQKEYLLRKEEYLLRLLK